MSSTETFEEIKPVDGSNSYENVEATANSDIVNIEVKENVSDSVLSVKNIEYCHLEKDSKYEANSFIDYKGIPRQYVDSKSELEAFFKKKLKKRNIHAYSLSYGYPSYEQLEYISYDIMEFNIEFSKDVKRTFLEQKTFRKFIIEIEENLREYLKSKKITSFNTIKFEKDWEIPSYKKIILQLNFYEIQFKDKLRLWSQIGKYIRNSLNELIRISPEKSKNKLEDLKNRFYIKINEF